MQQKEKDDEDGLLSSLLALRCAFCLFYRSHFLYFIPFLLLLLLLLLWKERISRRLLSFYKGQATTSFAAATLFFSIAAFRSLVARSTHLLLQQRAIARE